MMMEGEEQQYERRKRRKQMRGEEKGGKEEEEEEEEGKIGKRKRQRKRNRKENESSKERWTVKTQDPLYAEASQLQNEMFEEVLKFNRYMEEMIDDCNNEAANLQAIQQQLDQFISPDTVSEENENQKLRLNIGGTNYDLKRSTLLGEETSRLAGRLSLILQKRWERFLLQDRQGRVYLDYDMEWIEPIFRHLKGENNISVSTLEGISVGCNHLLDRFSMRIKLYSEISPEITGIKVKASFYSDIYENLREVIDAAIPNSRRVDFRKVYSYCHENYQFPTFNSNDLKGTVLIIVGSQRGKYCAITNQSLSSGLVINSASSLTARLSSPFEIFTGIEGTPHKMKTKKCSNAIFPIKFFYDVAVEAQNRNIVYFKDGIFSLNLAEQSFSESIENLSHFALLNPTKELVTWCEIYVLQNQYPSQSYAEYLFSQPSTEVDTEVPLIDQPVYKSNSSASLPCELQELLNLHLLNEVHKNATFCSKISKERRRIDQKLKQLLSELTFMALFIYNQWRGIILNFPKVYKHFDLEDYVKYFMEVLTLIEHHKKSMKEAKSLTEKVEMDPIACFNIDGERICVMKRSITEVFPGSQLAIRFSGRWREQSNDLDEEGNMNLEVSKYAFKRIISSIRDTLVVKHQKENERFTTSVEDKTRFHPNSSLVVKLPILMEKSKDVKGFLDYFAIDNVKLILQ